MRARIRSAAVVIERVYELRVSFLLGSAPA
jgi:hypothetical protein